MDSIVAQVLALVDQADEETRYHILESLRTLQRQVQSPKDVLMQLYNSNIQLAVVSVAVEIGVFKALATDAAHPLSVAELTERTNASPGLLERILRYLAAMGFLSNVSRGTFQANKTTVFLASPVADAAVIMAFESLGPAAQAFPSWAAENRYQDMTTNTNTPFQKGHSTDLSTFEYLAQRPRLFGAMQTVMAAIQSSEWILGLDVLDAAACAVSLAAQDGAQPISPERAFFVDVGGGQGHQCQQLLEKYPNLHGRLVLQDLPQAVDKLPSIDGVTVMAQDFFEEQAVKGAQFYYMRRIMHDWPDEQCLSILRHLRAAMGAQSAGESYILIDDVVLPDFGAPWQASVQDVSMAIQLAGKERTEQQWKELVARVGEKKTGESGLRIKHIKTYNQASCSSVLVLERE